MAPVAAAPLCRRRRADRWRLRNGASPARRLCRWLEPALLRSGRACVDEPGPEIIGAIGDGPAATGAAIVVRVCGRCGVVGGLVRDAGGSNRDVGGSDRSVGGRGRGVGGRVVFRRRFDVSVTDDGWDEANGDRTACAMEQRAAANLERSAPAAVGVLESGFRVFESSTWRPTGSTSSPWADKKSRPRMGLRTAARKNVTKNVRSPNERRRRMVPHVGIDLPSAPESCGPAGCALERCGRTLHTAPVSTMNCCLLSSSCKKIMPPPRAFSSRRLIRFPGPTGSQVCT